MEFKKVQAAIAEAEEFIRLAKELERQVPGVKGIVSGTKKSGQFNRQAMRLSEALIELRKRG